MSIDEILERVINICKHYRIQEVILFGSWAKGTANEFSDVDIAIKGAEDIERLREAIEEIPTLRSFDIVDMDNCKNELLLKEIEQYGRKIL